MIVIDKQINLDKPAIIRALQHAGYEKAVAENENVGSFDAFCLRTAGSFHFLAADKTTEVAVEHVAIILPGSAG